MHRWQKDLWAGLTGHDPKDMKVYMGGRQIGKSYMSQVWGIKDYPYFDVIDRATVDNEPWLTIKCSNEVSAWIKTQSKTMWHKHIDKNWIENTFDIHEKIYIMLQLKYSHDRI